jgi:hypothetical protein
MIQSQRDDWATGVRLLLTDFCRRGMPKESWRGILIWKFHIVPDLVSTDSPSILRSLLSHNAYPATFMHPYPDFPKPDARGPYILSRLSVDSFLPIAREVVWTQVIDPFLQGSRHPVSLAELGIDALVRTCIDDADELFQLQGDDADHVEMARILAVYREVISINRRDNSVLVLVTSED